MKILAALIVAASLCSQVQADEIDDKRAAFKRKMMPKVGKIVTIAGRLELGKGPDYIQTEDGGQVWLDSSDVNETNRLSRHIGKRFTVTGTLQFYKYVPPPKSPDGSVSGVPPEHFFMDIETST